MIFLGQNDVVGELTVEEVFLYYDGPRMFVAKNAVGQKYLVNCLPANDGSDSWLLSAVSDKRLSALRNGTLELRDVFAKPELGYVVNIIVGKDGSLLSHSMKKPAQLLVLLVPGLKAWLRYWRSLAWWQGRSLRPAL